MSVLIPLYDEDVGRATGSGEIQEDFMSNLSRISQLTGQLFSNTSNALANFYIFKGFSDPNYAEVFVKMHGFYIMLDVLLVNQSANTLQNLCLANKSSTIDQLVKIVIANPRVILIFPLVCS